jgi:hypothetical protein
MRRGGVRAGDPGDVEGETSKGDGIWDLLRFFRVGGLIASEDDEATADGEAGCACLWRGEIGGVKPSVPLLDSALSRSPPYENGEAGLKSLRGEGMGPSASGEEGDHGVEGEDE